MKKKLKALDVRAQAAIAGVLVLLVAVVGYMMVVSPQYAQGAKLRTELSAEQSLIEQRQVELKAGLHPPTIETADLFRLARAMPDREDMPGIILTLSQVSAAAGIKFDLIEPASGSATTPTAGSYTVERIHLQFHGDFYGLSDFLFRLRSLVAVHDGQLEASGRLFNVDSLQFQVGGKFPEINADLFVDAYIYTSTAAATGTPVAPTTTAPSTDSLPNDASAAGATP
jgi:Tfp pilus assembly protein PilO